MGVRLGPLVQLQQTLLAPHCFLSLGQERFYSLSLILRRLSLQLIQQAEGVGPTVPPHGRSGSTQPIGQGRLVFPRYSLFLLAAALCFQFLLPTLLGLHRLLAGLKFL
jgi:hypothetical protein